MSSLASLVSTGGPIKSGDPDGDDVRALQLALSQAGYRVGQDGQFGPRTLMVVQQFQTQHGLKSDGVVGALTAALLDAPSSSLVATALSVSSPMALTATGPVFMVPHDDTASLLAFYNRPWDDHALLTSVPLPFTILYRDEKSVATLKSVQFHVKGAKALQDAFEACWEAGSKDLTNPMFNHIRNFSGTYNYRPIRGSSRLSCHAFGAAIDFDAEHLPLGKNIPASEMPEIVVKCFKDQGFFWGGDYTGRKDAMHFQLAHE